MLAPLLLLVGVLGWCNAQFSPNCDGKQVIVHLFEWKWTDIAAECTRFLGPMGFCGVQISPPNEHTIITLPEADRPWWERYQPISYKLKSRGGTEQQLKDMIATCNSAGVRIFVDAILNHMAGLNRRGTGIAGSSFNSDDHDFPGVPFTKSNFHTRADCPSGDGNVNNYGDPRNVRNCNLVGLTDLDQSQAYVRQKQVAYLNSLIDIGVAGFRLDASKHMWPNDLAAIIHATKDLNTKWFKSGARPFYMHEVIDRNDGAVKTQDYENLGIVTEFRYSQKVAWGIGNFGQLSGVVDYGWGMEKSDRAFVFVDNHDNQRGHGGGGDVVTFKDPRKYKMAVAFLLANDYGFTRIMSSYKFNGDSDGPPHNADYSAKDVLFNGDGSCGNGWVCEHRWKPIANMVKFRNAVAGTSKGNFRNQNDQVSFSRGNKGFFAMAKNGHMDATLNTGLPAGQYCDVIHDCATKITVDGSGHAHIVISNNDEPIAAFYVGGHGGGGYTGPTSAPLSTPAPVSLGTPSPGFTKGWKRTVIFVYRTTRVGEDMFIRGGIDHTRQTGCVEDAATSPCAIPIKHRAITQTGHYPKFTAWQTGDHFLDWYGGEPGQGSYQGHPPDGTPALWTTNKANNPSHESLNTYGDHYWMVDVDMDCSRTKDGWFEVKSVVNGHWESSMSSRAACTGTAGGIRPFASENHEARCGFVNVFHFGSDFCEINSF